MAWLPTRHHEEFFTSHLDQDILHSSTFSYRYGHFWLKKKKKQDYNGCNAKLPQQPTSIIFQLLTDRMKVDAPCGDTCCVFMLFPSARTLVLHCWVTVLAVNLDRHC